MLPPKGGSAPATTASLAGAQQLPSQQAQRGGVAAAAQAVRLAAQRSVALGGQRLAARIPRWVMGIRDFFFSLLVLLSCLIAGARGLQRAEKRGQRLSLTACQSCSGCL